MLPFLKHFSGLQSSGKGALVSASRFILCQHVFYNLAFVDYLVGVYMFNLHFGNNPVSFAKYLFYKVF